jgi:hypothetical protein
MANEVNFGGATVYLSVDRSQLQSGFQAASQEVRRNVSVMQAEMDAGRREAASRAAIYQKYEAPTGTVERTETVLRGVTGSMFRIGAVGMIVRSGLDLVTAGIEAQNGQWNALRDTLASLPGGYGAAFGAMYTLGYKFNLFGVKEVTERLEIEKAALAWQTKMMQATDEVRLRIAQNGKSPEESKVLALEAQRRKAVKDASDAGRSDEPALRQYLETLDKEIALLQEAARYKSGLLELQQGIKREQSFWSAMQEAMDATADAGLGERGKIETRTRKEGRDALWTEEQTNRVLEQRLYAYDRQAEAADKVKAAQKAATEAAAEQARGMQFIADEGHARAIRQIEAEEAARTPAERLRERLASIRAEAQAGLWSDPALNHALAAARAELGGGSGYQFSGGAFNPFSAAAQGGARSRLEDYGRRTAEATETTSRKIDMSIPKW